MKSVIGFFNISMNSRTKNVGHGSSMPDCTGEDLMNFNTSSSETGSNRQNGSATMKSVYQKLWMAYYLERQL